MNRTMIKPIGLVLAGLLVIVAVLYLAGYKITVVSRDQIGPMGQGQRTPGWRRGESAQNPMASPGSGQGRRQQMSGGGEGQQSSMAGPGSQQGRGSMGGGGGRASAAQSGRQPGFGPSGGILLPIQPGTNPIPLVVNGKQAASFVGKDLVDHVEDTVIATAEGPRKGWGVSKTLTYFRIKDAKEVTVYDKSGKKLTVKAEQVMDDQTLLLLTYDGGGSLLLVSGPKVRGTNKGMTSQEQVIQMVAGRKDLVSFPNVVRIEVKG